MLNDTRTILRYLILNFSINLGFKGHPGVIVDRPLQMHSWTINAIKDFHFGRVSFQFQSTPNAIYFAKTLRLILWLASDS